MSCTSQVGIALRNDIVIPENVKDILDQADEIRKMKNKKVYYIFYFFNWNEFNDDRNTIMTWITPLIDQNKAAIIRTSSEFQDEEEIGNCLEFNMIINKEIVCGFSSVEID